MALFLFQSYNYLTYSNVNHIEYVVLSFSFSNLFDSYKTELLMYQKHTEWYFHIYFLIVWWNKTFIYNWIRCSKFRCLVLQFDTHLFFVNVWDLHGCIYVIWIGLCWSNLFTSMYMWVSSIYVFSCHYLITSGSYLRSFFSSFSTSNV